MGVAQRGEQAKFLGQGQEQAAGVGGEARSNGDAFERDCLAAQAIVSTVDTTHSASSKQIEHFIALPDWSRINRHGRVLRLSAYQGIIIGRCYEQLYRLYHSAHARAVTIDLVC